MAEWNSSSNLSKSRGVHLNLIYVYTCKNPLFNGGYLSSFVEYFLPYK